MPVIVCVMLTLQMYIAHGLCAQSIDAGILGHAPMFVHLIRVILILVSFEWPKSGVQISTNHNTVNTQGRKLSKVAILIG